MFYPISRGSVALSQRTNSTEMSNKYALGILQRFIYIRSIMPGLWNMYMYFYYTLYMYVALGMFHFSF